MSSSADYSYEAVKEVADYLKAKTSCCPKVAIICGSGLGNLAEAIKGKETYPYSEIPHFPSSTVAGHQGQLVFGKLGEHDTHVMCMQGRFHPYEGYEAWKIGLPIRVMKLMGIEVIMITNAAGGINRKFNVGDFMILRDHISFPGLGGYNPLRGHNDENFGPRFPAVTPAYDKDLRQKFWNSIKHFKLENITHEGVYCNVAGPSYETIAELKMFLTCGGDAIGMSTAQEVIAAAHAGLKVVVCSLITNKCILEYDSTDAPNHEEVLATANRRAKDMEKVVTHFISSL